MCRLKSNGGELDRAALDGEGIGCCKRKPVTAIELGPLLEAQPDIADFAWRQRKLTALFGGHG